MIWISCVLHGNSCEELLTFTVTGVSVHVARITSLSVHRARLVILWSLVSNSRGGALSSCSGGEVRPGCLKCHWDQNFGIPCFYIFERSLWFLVTMPNFNLLRRLEVAFFGRFLSRFCCRHYWPLFRKLACE